MGLFSSIGKFFKKVWSGVKKVFSKIMKPIAKLLDSKLGKALMLAVSVFSMGSALLAGGKGFLAGEGFIGKFINGGKEFLNSLIGTKFETVGGDAAAGAADATGAASVTGEVAGNAVSAGDVLTGGDPTAAVDAAAGAAPAAGGAGAGAAAIPGAAVPGAAPGAATSTLQTGGNLAAPAAEMTAKGGWLSKAANAAMDFAKSDAGGTIIGNVIAGAGSAARQKNQQEFDSRVQRAFEDPNDPGVKALAEHDYSVDTPRGLAAAPGRLAQRENQASGRYTPNIPFRRPVPMQGG